MKKIRKRKIKRKRSEYEKNVTGCLYSNDGDDGHGEGLFSDLDDIF